MYEFVGSVKISEYFGCLPTSPLCPPGAAGAQPSALLRLLPGEALPDHGALPGAGAGEQGGRGAGGLEYFNSPYSVNLLYILGVIGTEYRFAVGSRICPTLGDVYLYYRWPGWIFRGKWVGRGCRGRWVGWSCRGRDRKEQGRATREEQQEQAHEPPT